MKEKSIRKEIEQISGEEFFRNIIQTTTDGFLLINEEGRLLDVNSAYARMSGYSKEELLNMTVFQLESQETHHETTNHLKKIIENRSDYFESIHKTKKNSFINVEISISFLPEQKQFISFVRDITDRKKAEIKENEKIRFLDKIIESSALSLWISDEKGTAIKTNPACLKFFGATEEEVIGKYNLFKDSELEKHGFMPEIEEIFKKGKVAEIELDYNFKEVDHVQVAKATHKIIRSTYTPILDSNGKVTNVIAQASDLTDITRTKNTLEITAHNLGERVKELNCLYGISKILGVCRAFTFAR